MALLWMLLDWIQQRRKGVVAEVIEKPCDYEAAKRSRRFVLCIYQGWILVGLVVWYFLTAVKRYPLMKGQALEQIAESLSSLPVQRRCNVVSICGSPSPSSTLTIVQILHNHLPMSNTHNGTLFEVPASLDIFNSVCPMLASSSVGMTQLLEVAGQLKKLSKAEASNRYNLILAQPPNLSLDKPLFVLTAERLGLFVLPSHPTADHHMDSIVAAAESLKVILNKTWYQPMHAPTLDFASEHVFNFLLVGDGDIRLSWNFELIFRRYFRHFISRLGMLFDVSTESQVILHGGMKELSSAPTAESRPDSNSPVYISKDGLSHFLSVANDWTPSNVLTKPTVRPPPIQNFALYVPSLQEVRFSSSKSDSHTSFTLPSWGTLVSSASLREYSDTESSIKGHVSSTSDQVAAAASHWIGAVRSLLGLSPRFAFASVYEEQEVSGCNYRTTSFDDMSISLEIPSHEGVTLWEVGALQSWYQLEYTRRALEMLRGLLTVVEQLRDLEVDERVYLSCQRAAHHLKEVVAYSEQENSNEAVKSARRAFQESIEAFHDESTMSNTHFRTEVKQAIYLPLVAPFVVPILFHSIRELAAVWRERKAKIP